MNMLGRGFARGIAVVAWAASVVVLLLRAGRGGMPRLLVVLFTVWMLSPLVAFALARRFSQRRSVVTRAALAGVALALMLGSLALYANPGWRPAGARLAFVFVIVPPACWLLMALAVGVAAMRSARPPRPGPGT